MSPEELPDNQNVLSLPKKVTMVTQSTNFDPFD